MAAQPKPFPRVQTIHVHPNGHADKDPASLSMSNQEEAVFSTKISNLDAQVVFDIDGTPFGQTNFPVPAGTDTPSGALKKGVKEGEHYRYHVKPMKGGGPGGDPEIIITK